jgi:hypothetical protein
MLKLPILGYPSACTVPDWYEMMYVNVTAVA